MSNSVPVPVQLVRSHAAVFHGAQDLTRLGTLSTGRLRVLCHIVYGLVLHRMRK